MARKPPLFFDNEQYLAMRSMLGESGANSLDQRLSVLSDVGPSGGMASIEGYGAKGDGRTNDSQAVADAIAAIGNVGTIYFGRGNYIVKDVNLPASIKISGLGKDATIVSLPATANTASDVCFVIPDDQSLTDAVIGEMTVNHSIISTTSAARRRAILLGDVTYPGTDLVYTYRHPATSAAQYLNRDDFCVQIGSNLWAVHSFKQYAGTSVRTLGQCVEGRAGLFTPATDGNTTRVGSWSSTAGNGTVVTGTPDTGGGNYRSIAVDNGTMEFTPGANTTGNAFCLVIVAASNNGYGIVEVDGDQTGTAAGANLLPKVTASMTVSGGGTYLDSDLGKTYIDFYATSSLDDEHVGIAENLDEDMQHSIKIYCRATKGTLASAGVSVRIAGLIACRFNSLPNAANHRMARMRKINDSNEALSAQTAAFGWSPTASTSNSRFMGENHVGSDAGVAIAETAVSLVVTDDAGETVTPTQGTWFSSKSYTIDRVTAMTRDAAAVCTKRVVYKIKPNKALQVTASGTIVFVANGYLDIQNIGMLPAYQMRNRYGSTYEKTDFDKCLVGDKLVTDLEWTSGSSREYSVKNADTIALFSTSHDTVWLAHTPRVDITLNNSIEAGAQTYLRVVAAASTAPGGLKGYMGRHGQGTLGYAQVAAPAGTTLEFEVGWRAFRVKRAGEVLQLRN